MKWLGIVTGLILLLLAAVYGLLFTSPGNRLIAPLIVNRIDRATALQTSLERFELRPGRFVVTLLLSPDNRIEAEGDFTVFSRGLKANYRVRCNDLSALQPLTKTPLYGRFHTAGTVNGSLNNLLITGSSDIAESATSYSVTLVDLNPASIKAVITDAKAAQLLLLVGKKPFSTADLSLDMDLKNVDPKALDGDLVLTVTRGTIDTDLMKKEFDLTLPQTSYSLKATSHLAGRTITYAVTLESNLAHFSSEGTVAPESLQTDLSYRLDARELALFKPLTNAPLRGPFMTSGTVKGDRLKMTITGTSDIAASESNYDLTLEELKPRQVLVKINHAQLDKLLYMGEQPSFAKGRLDVDLNLTDLDPDNLKGQATVKIGNGELVGKVFKREYDIDLPQTAFTCGLEATLKGKEVAYQARFDSNLAGIDSQGGFIPKTLGLDLNYRIDIAKLELLKPLTKAPLRGPFKTSGTVKGDRLKMTIAGTSDIAASQTNYDLTLEELKPRQVLFKINHAQLDKLLYMGEQPSFAKGSLDVDLNLTDLDPDNLKGKAEVKIGNGELVSAVFKKEYDIDLPLTAFTCGLAATLKGKEVDYRMQFDSNPAKFGSEGSLVPKTFGLDLNYRVDIAKLELLQPITGTPLRGAMKFSGTAKGDRELLNVEGSSDLAGGETTFRAVLTDFKPASIKAKIKNLQLAKALSMAAKPHYADGVLNVDVDIANAKSGELKGKVTSEISRGMLDSKVIATEFELGELPQTTFTVKAQTTLEGKFVDTAANLDSSLLTLKVNRLRYDSSQALLTSDYLTDIPDLDKLFFIAGRHLKGAMTVKGELKKGEHLDFTAQSDTLGGRLDATIHDDDVHAVIKKVQTLEALKLLIYPEIFASSLDGTLDYNLKQKKGIFAANLSDGKFTRNIMLDLLLTLAQTDLYKERFTGTLHSNINRELITSDLDLRSNTSSISGKNTTLNSKTKQVNAKLDVVANNNLIPVTIKGTVDKPEVKLDTSALLKNEANKALQKEVNKLLKNLF